MKLETYCRNPLCGRVLCPFGDYPGELCHVCASANRHGYRVGFFFGGAAMLVLTVVIFVAAWTTI